MLVHTPNSRSSRSGLHQQLAEQRKTHQAKIKGLVDKVSEKIRSLYTIENERPLEEFVRTELSKQGDALQEELVSTVFKTDGQDEKQLREQHNSALSFLKYAAEPLVDSSFKLPQPHFAIRYSAVVGFAVGGAIIGIWILGPAVRMLLGFPGEVGVLIGGPTGAAIGVSLLFLLANNPTIITALQWLLGGFVAGDVVFSLIDAVNPLSQVRGLLFGGKPAFWSLPSRLLVYCIVWLLLRLARPKLKARLDDVVLMCEERVKAWLDSQIVLLTVYAQWPADSPADSPPVDQHQWAADLVADITSHVQRLHNVSGPEVSVLPEVEGHISHIVTAMRNAGISIDLNSPGESPPGSKAHHLVWEDSLLERFITFGDVRVGDEVTILEQPVEHDGATLKRGTVQRRRRK